MRKINERTTLMLDLSARLAAFEMLGKFIGQTDQKSDDPALQKLNHYFYEGFQNTIQQARIYNGWFTEENVKFALRQWSEALSRENLNNWISRYPDDYFKNDDSKTVAVIMAGNLPLVGFHDFLSVVLSGHKILVKPSSDDDKLLPFLCQVLVAIEKDFAPRIRFAEGKLTDFDAVIATGSNNSSRYFDYYFSKYPHIIRKNRHSVAVLDGNVSDEDLRKLSEDIFRYFGMGCRNVSKLFLPKGFDVQKIFQNVYHFKTLIDNKKYGNNYDYNRAIFLMEQIAFLDNGSLMMRENENWHAPVSILHYEFYENLEEVKQVLNENAEQLQAVVSHSNLFENAVPFGEAQKPKLWDYADRVDTIQFLRAV